VSEDEFLRYTGWRADCAASASSMSAAALGTVDMLAPAHDHPQTQSTLRAWFEEAGLLDLFVDRMGFIVRRGTK
jgi:hypothetical protein